MKKILAIICIAAAALMASCNNGGNITDPEDPQPIPMSFGVDCDADESFEMGEVREFGVTQTEVANIAITTPTGWTATIETNILTVTAPEAEGAEIELTGTITLVASNSVDNDITVSFGVSATPKLTYELRILTFEDEDYKGPNGSGYWSSLIDSPQNNGPLLYPDDEDFLYSWYDDGNTGLGAELPMGFGDNFYWGGGHAVSNYVETDASKGSPSTQLSVYYKDPVTGKGGHNGSNNFCVHYGSKPVADKYTQLPYIYFTDNIARVIDHMYVMSTTYTVNSVINGDALSGGPFGEGDYLRIVATGYDANFEEIVGINPTFELAGPNGPITEWQKWDLSELGEVFMIEFNILGSRKSGAYVNTPTYFAYDDLAVRFDL